VAPRPARARSGGLARTADRQGPLDQVERAVPPRDLQGPHRGLRAPTLAGWGDDPVMAELQQAIADGWLPVRVSEELSGGESFDVVTGGKDGETRGLKRH